MTTTSVTSARRAMDDLLAESVSRRSVEEEQAVLGAMMLAAPGSDIPGTVRGLLRPRRGEKGAGEHHFCRPAHRKIWLAIVALMDASKPFDALSVSASLDTLARQAVGGVPYLHTCVEACPTVLNAPVYARDLAGATLLRDLGEAAAVQTQMVLNSSLHAATDVYARVRARLEDIEVPQSGDGPVPWTVLGKEPGTDDDVLEELERLDKLADNPELGAAEFTTGWIDVDRLLAQVVPGALIILAGRPGMAKTTAAVNIAAHLAMEKRLPVLFFSLEMSRLEIGLKVLSLRARLRSEDIKHGTLGGEGWGKARDKIEQDAGAPLHIDDRVAITLDYLDAQLAAFVHEHGRAPVAFFVDHIGLMEDHGLGSDREKLERISKGLKKLAKKYATVCVALSQLNRGPESRPGGVPQLSDLRSSGSIEQDADIVALLHREDYYDKESTRIGEMDVIFAKHRNGPTATITLVAQLHMSRVASMEFH